MIIYIEQSMLKTQVEKPGGVFSVTDMYRDWMMQMQAHHDWKTGKKTAYSPPPGQSFHNAARSKDVDVQLIDESLNPTGYAKKGFDLYWEIYRDLGFTGVFTEFWFI